MAALVNGERPEAEQGIAELNSDDELLGRTSGVLQRRDPQQTSPRD